MKQTSSICMESFPGDKTKPRRSWFSLIAKNRALCVFIQLKGEKSERPVFLEGDFTDSEPQ